MIRLEKLKLDLERIRSRHEELMLPDDVREGAHVVPFYVQIMPKVVGAERCSVFILNPETNTIWLKAGTGVKQNEIELPTAGSIAGRVIETGKPIIDNAPAHHDRIEAKTNFIARNVLCVPISSPFRDEITGAFEVLNKVGENGFTADDLAMVEQIAGRLKLEVDRIFLHQETFGLTERLYDVARTATLALMAGVVALVILALIVLLVYIAVPVVLG